MAKFDFLSVWRKMGETGIVPVFYHADAEMARAVVSACYAGGIRVFEFTNRGDGAHEVFAALVRYVRSECPDMALGAGTVTDAATAALYMQSGADFIVGPTFNADVARTCHRRSLPYVPGCGTVTEVSDAQAAGCPVCKLFPGDVLTPRFVKDLLAPLPWSKLMVTGGVEPTEENLSAWFRAGAYCVGMGSKLFPASVLSAADWGGVTARCREALEIVRRVRE